MKRTFEIVSIAVFVMVLTGTGSVSAAVHEQKLTAADGEFEDSLGTSVSISGDYAIVGAPQDDDNGRSSGSGYVFQRGAGGVWTQDGKLTASDGATADGFGKAVAISGDYVVVGAHGDDDDNGDNSGSAYIFERSGGGAWVQEPKLTASDGAADDRFGTSVSISGDYAVIGSPQDADKGAFSGSAYIFDRSADGTWMQGPKLMASDGTSLDMFGQSVSIDGDRAVIGAWGGDGNVGDSGSAYVFERDPGGTWVEQAKLVASDGARLDGFGHSVSISGDYAIVGAFADDDNGSNSGSAYVFERGVGGTWTQKAGLLASDGQKGDLFGLSVSISGEHAVVGAWGNEDKGDNSGSAYLFERGADGTWSQQQKLVLFDGAADDKFGYSVSISISDGRAIIGATSDDGQGSAHIYGGIPEPGTLGMLVIGSLTLLRKRRK